MSNPLADLQQILSIPRKKLGKVVSLTKNRAMVATDQGLMEVEIPMSSTVQPGDRVTVQDGKVFKRGADSGSMASFV